MNPRTPAQQINVPTLARYRTGGYGAMVETATGPYVRVDDMRELLQTLEIFAVAEDKPLVAHLIQLLNEGR